MSTPLARIIDLPPRHVRTVKSYRAVMIRLEVAARNHKLAGNVVSATELKNAIYAAKRRVHVGAVIRAIVENMK